jgi:conjugal transfer mating pair stabilization protein TraG
VSSFTSSFISTADLGNWDYYIFSDNVAIWRALNGLAAWFGGSGPLLQGAALLGSLIILSMFLWQGATKSSRVNTASLGIWFFFMTMLGITGKANIHNIYTGQVTVVSNVPALTLVPASVFSKAAYKVFQNMDTSFQGVNGSYMQVSQFGFVGPLDVLLSLRSPGVSNNRRALYQTLAQVFRDCSMDPNASSAVPPMENALDLTQWLKQFGRQSGVTRVYLETDPNTSGTVVPCAISAGDPPVVIGGQSYSGASDYVDKQFTTLASGSTELLRGVNAETTRRNPRDANGRWTSSSIPAAYDMLIGSAVGMAQNAVQFTKNALVAATVTYTMDCISQGGAISSTDTCASGALAMADSMEKWKTQAAMAGSGFLKTMFTSMGVLQALFFALFPIIAVYALVVPHRTARIFGGFVFFGIWCQSWLLAVTPIQSYIQTSIVDTVSKLLGPSSGMTLANSTALYQTLSTKLAVASDIMASSQMLSLALLSGSMVALSGVAQKWSAERYMDTNKLQHDLAKAPSLVDFKPINSVSSIANRDGQMTSLVAKTGAGDYKIQSTGILNSTRGVSTDQSNSRDVARSKEQSFAAALSTKFGMDRGQAAAVAKTMTAVDSLKGHVGTGIAKALGGALSGAVTKHTGKPVSPLQAQAIENLANRAQETAITQLATKDASFLGRLMGKAGSSEQANAVGQVIDTGSTVLSGLLATAGTATGIGAPVGFFSAAVVKGGAEVAKQSLMSRIRSGGAEVAKDTAVAGALNTLTNGPRGVEAFAKGISGNMGAVLEVALQDQSARSLNDSASKKLSRDNGFTAADADKIMESWRTTQSESSSQSDSHGQTQTIALTLDKENIMRAGLKGVDGLSGEQLRARAASNAAALRAYSDPKAVAAANRRVRTATTGRTAQDYGGGRAGEELAQYEQNVLFEHFMTGQVSGSMLNTETGAALGKVVPLTTTPSVQGAAGRWEKVPPGRPGAKDKKPEEESRALRDWALVDGNNPVTQAAAAKAGLRWVPGTQGRPETISITPLPSDAVVASPLRPDEAPRVPQWTASPSQEVTPQTPIPKLPGQPPVQGPRSPFNQAFGNGDNFVPTNGLGGGVGASPGFSGRSDALIGRGDQENQRTFDRLKPSDKALEQFAPGAVQSHNDKTQSETLKIVAITAADLVASTVDGFQELKRNNQGSGGGGAPSDQRKPPEKDGQEKPKREPVNRRTRANRMSNRSK